MPTFYTIYQNKNSKSSTNGKFYAKARCLGYWDLEQLSDHIQDNVSAKKSDVIAVLRELVVVMKEAFDAGYGVRLDGFGRFKVGLKSKPAENRKDFSATKHIVGNRINFQPETHWSAATGNKRTNPFTTGMKVKEYGAYNVEEEEGEQEEP